MNRRGVAEAFRLVMQARNRKLLWQVIEPKKEKSDSGTDKKS